MRKFYIHLDKKVKEILDLLDDNTTVMVVSDHGAKAMKGLICVNMALEKLGFLKFKKEHVNRLLVVVTLLALVAMVRVLAYVEGSFRHKMTAEVETNADKFAASGELKTPKDLNVDISAVQRLAETSKASSWIKEVVVVKRVNFTDCGEKRVVLFPYQYEADNPSSWEKTSDPCAPYRSSGTAK